MSDARSAALIADDDSLHRKDIEYLRAQEKATDVSGALSRRSSLYAVKRALGKFGADGCTDLAAALTYHAVLSLFPTLIALVSLLGVFGQGEETIDSIMEMLEGTVPESTMGFVQGPIEQLVNTDAAGFALIAGLAGALWTASGYVGAFSRALNRIYGVAEGRPIWKLRPVLFAVTALMVVMLASAGLILTLSGGIAETIFELVGLGEVALMVWSWAKWPVLLAIVILVLAVLYQLTPNVKRPHFRFLSLGGLVALLVAAAGGLGFSFYAANFGSYNATYGSLAGIIMFLLLLWILNNALLLGAEIDSEQERARQLRSGIQAEEEIMLPLRDESGVIKAHQKKAATIADAADIRREAWVQNARED